MKLDLFTKLKYDFQHIFEFVVFFCPSSDVFLHSFTQPKIFLLFDGALYYGSNKHFRRPDKFISFLQKKFTKEIICF